MYGAGVQTYATSLVKASPGLSMKEATKLAKKAIAFKKGKKDDKGYFHGGIDSDSFNAMFKIAMSSIPTLPVLGTKISQPLRPDKCGKTQMTTRMNWVNV